MISGSYIENNSSGNDEIQILEVHSLEKSKKCSEKSAQFKERGAQKMKSLLDTSVITAVTPKEPKKIINIIELNHFPRKKQLIHSKKRMSKQKVGTLFVGKKERTTTDMIEPSIKKLKSHKVEVSAVQKDIIKHNQSIYSKKLQKTKNKMYGWSIETVIHEKDDSDKDSNGCAGGSNLSASKLKINDDSDNNHDGLDGPKPSNRELKERKQTSQRADVSNDFEFDTNQQKFKCKRCEKYFSGKTSVVHHLRNICGIEPKHNCNLCDFKSKSMLCLKVHVQKFHDSV